MSFDSPSVQPSSKSRGLILAGLISIAITGPVLDALRRNETYRNAARIGLFECLILAVLLTFVLTPLVIGVDRLVQRLSRFARGRGRNLVLFVLLFLAALACLRPVMTKSLAHLQLDWLALIALALPAAALVVARFERSARLRRFLALMAAGVVLFPATFTMHFVRTPAVASAGRSQPLKFSTPTNVIIVVFDEMTGTSLRSSELTIDEGHFPNFARLARSSTWYTNATSSHARTDKAVPAILASRVATEDIPPIPENYPDNLLQLLDESQQFGLTVFETITRLFEHPSERPSLETSFSERVSELIVSTATAYPRLILPADSPVALPDPTPLWQGIQYRPSQPDRIDGRIPYSWNIERDLQLNHFLETIQPRDQSHLWFLHSGLPHFPWCFAANGRPYLDEKSAAWPPPTSVGEIGEEWSDDIGETLRCEFRYRQQLGVVDRFIGDLQDRLQAQGLWDSCMLVVMADHGVCFRPGSSRRYPHALNTADLLNIPLFIKYPGQTVGCTDPRNIESIDILPTIADVLGIDEAPAWSGQSALQDEQRLRKSFRFEDGEVVTTATLPGIAESVERQYQAFGKLPLDQLPAAAMAFPAIRGHELSAVAIPDVQVDSLRLALGSQRGDLVQTANFCPQLVQGSLDRAEVPAGAKALVAAIDGVVVDSCRFVDRPAGESEFHMILPEAAADRPGAVLELFAAPTENIRDWKRLHRQAL